MGVTDDPLDPRLGRGIDAEPVNQNEVYLVMSDEERAKGFVRPLHKQYVHRRSNDTIMACGTRTLINSNEIAETYARNPKFYGATYCVGCRMHLPVELFDWDDNGGGVVGE